MVRACLIGGTGRCGTTILKKVFEKHPQCCSTPEFSITVDPDGILDYCLTLSQVWTPYIFDQKTKRLLCLLRSVAYSPKAAEAWNYAMRNLDVHRRSPIKLSRSYLGVGLQGYCASYMDKVRKLEHKLVSFRYHAIRSATPFLGRAQALHGRPNVQSILSEFLTGIMDCIAKKERARFFIDDNTFNILWFHQYQKLIPNARLVHIYRDPRDVVASYLTQAWTPKDAEKASVYYRDIMSRWQEVKKMLPQGSYMEISLEELVRYRQQTISKIAGFYKIPWHTCLLETNLDKSNSGRWKKDLSPKEKKTVQKVLGKTISGLGYHAAVD